MKSNNSNRTISKISMNIYRLWESSKNSFENGGILLLPAKKRRKLDVNYNINIENKNNKESKRNGSLHLST